MLTTWNSRHLRSPRWEARFATIVDVLIQIQNTAYVRYRINLFPGQVGLVRDWTLPFPPTDDTLVVYDPGTWTSGKIYEVFEVKRHRQLASRYVIDHIQLRLCVCVSLSLSGQTKQSFTDHSKSFSATANLPGDKICPLMSCFTDQNWTEAKFLRWVCSV